MRELLVDRVSASWDVSRQFELHKTHDFKLAAPCYYLPLSISRLAALDVITTVQPGRRSLRGRGQSGQIGPVKSFA